MKTKVFSKIFHLGKLVRVLYSLENFLPVFDVLPEIFYPRVKSVTKGVSPQVDKSENPEHLGEGIFLALYPQGP